jgi:hypothetical protein
LSKKKKAGIDKHDGQMQNKHGLIIFHCHLKDIPHIDKIDEKHVSKCADEQQQSQSAHIRIDNLLPKFFPKFVRNSINAFPQQYLPKIFHTKLMR